jgi:hypothetical protein
MMASFQEYSDTSHHLKPLSEFLGSLYSFAACKDTV